VGLSVLWTYQCLTCHLPLCTDQEAKDHLLAQHLVVDFPGRRHEQAPDRAV
jgi:hypothetical protein